MCSNLVRENSSIKQRISFWWVYKICAVRKSSGTAVSFPRVDSTNQGMRTPRFLVESELVISKSIMCYWFESVCICRRVVRFDLHSRMSGGIALPAARANHLLVLTGLRKWFRSARRKIFMWIAAIAGLLADQREFMIPGID